MMSMKTTIAYNCAVIFEKWFKTVMVDLDTQCNLSMLAGENRLNNLFLVL